jgi:phosphate transport system protein
VADELRTQFHTTLGELHDRIRELVELVHHDVGASMEALMSGDMRSSHVLGTSDALVERLYESIEQTIHTQIALQAPVARDLRMLLAMLRVVPDLERSHHLCELIARRGVTGLGQELSPRARELAARMGELDELMWRRLGEAVVTWSDIVDELEDRDDELDELHVSLIAEIASGAVAVPVALDMVLVGRFLERLGDHAVNVARRIRI